MYLRLNVWESNKCLFYYFKEKNNQTNKYHILTEYTHDRRYSLSNNQMKPIKPMGSAVRWGNEVVHPINQALHPKSKPQTTANRQNPLAVGTSHKCFSKKLFVWAILREPHATSLSHYTLPCELPRYSPYTAPQISVLLIQGMCALYVTWWYLHRSQREDFVLILIRKLTILAWIVRKSLTSHVTSEISKSQLWKKS